MAINERLREKIRQISAELRFDLFGPKGYPAWGTKFEDIEDATGEVGDALACAEIARRACRKTETASLDELAEKIGLLKRSASRRNKRCAIPSP